MSDDPRPGADTGPEADTGREADTGVAGPRSTGSQPTDGRGPERAVPDGDTTAAGGDGVGERDGSAAAGGDGAESGEGSGAPAGERAAGLRGRVSSASLMIAVLLAGLGFTLVVQLRNVSEDPALGAARQEDLVRILSDLQAREQRLNADIAELEESRRQLTSGVASGQAALAEASRRADELGILAGSLPATGPGLLVRFSGNTDQVKARAVLDAVEELRGAGAEAMQISGVDGSAVRVVASTYFLDGEGGINVDGKVLTAPYTVAVIGDPETMRTALNIPGGVVELVGQSGGTVTMNDSSAVEVTARHVSGTMQYARPVS